MLFAARPASHATLSPAWNRERAARLHRLFTRVAAKAEQGISVCQSLRQHRHSRTYRTTRRAQYRLGFSRLRTLYYAWLNGGRSLESLLVKLPGGRPAVPAATVRAFILACATAGTATWTEAARQIGTKGDVRRILTALPDAARQTIRELMNARVGMREAVRKLDRDYRRSKLALLVADTARRRRILAIAGRFPA